MRLEWGALPPEYDLGLDRGVLYFSDKVVPWSGLVGLAQQDTGENNVDHYFDGVRIHITQDIGEYQAALSAFTYPEEFVEAIDGTFGMSYRTSNHDRYQIHILYGVKVKDKGRSYKTEDNTADPSLFEWDVYTTAVPIEGASPASHLLIESTKVEVIDLIEDILYGTEETEPRLPDVSELLEMYEEVTILKIRYLGDGTWTATGPDEMVQVDEDGVITLNSPSLFNLEDGVFVVSSY